MSNEVAKIDRMPAQVSTPADLLRLAVEGGADLDRLERLMTMQLQWEANEARKAYDAAMAAFKAEAVTVTRTSVRSDGPLKGKRYASVDDYVSSVTGALSKHGLSASWKITKNEPKLIEVTCYIKHVQGHADSTSLSAEPDTGPGRNSIQALKSAITYLERITFQAILGLSDSDSDDDGNGGRDEAAESEFARVSQWIDKSAACDTREALEKAKAECIESYGMRDKVPRRVQAAFATRMKELSA